MYIRIAMNFVRVMPVKFDAPHIHILQSEKANTKQNKYNNGTLKIFHCGIYYDTAIIRKTPLHDIKKAVKSARMERSGFKYIKHTRRWASQLTHLNSQTKTQRTR
jgi:hypothetical protein